LTLALSFQENFVDEVRIVDTTLRDGDISLWAYGMTTGMMLPALLHLDEAGFDSMVTFVPTISLNFDSLVRLAGSYFPAHETVKEKLFK
jgi:pyruvate/oxaloacetate carboxyltransferase